MHHFVPKKIIDFWNDFSKKYEENIEQYTLPVNFTLYSLCKAYEANSVLEVGIGPGRAPFMFTNGLMKKGAVYYGTDISLQKW